MVISIHSFTPIYKGKTRSVELGILHDRDTTLSSKLIKGFPNLEQKPTTDITDEMLVVLDGVPDLPTAVAELVTQGVQAVRIVPMFLGVGKHAREDLPVLVQALRTTYPQLALSLQGAVGENPRLVELLAHIALESA